MAALEQLVQQALQSLVAGLASYQNAPAVFIVRAGDEGAPEWNAAPEYPRIVLTVTTGWDAQTRVDGVARLYIDADESDIPALSDAVIAALSWRIFQPDNQPPTILRPRAQMPETLQIDEEQQISEQEIDFDVIELTSGATFTPDPVDTITASSADLFAATLNTNPASWGATDALPALWWTLGTYSGGRMVRTLSKGRVVQRWDAELRGHVLSPNAALRDSRARLVAESLGAINSWQMADGSYMDIIVRPSLMRMADAIRDGQVRLVVNFRTISAGQPVLPLRYIHTDTSSDQSDLAVRSAAP